MTQMEINRAVARATGESVARVNKMGFSEMPMPRQAPLRLTQLYQRARLARNGRRNHSSTLSVAAG